MNQNNLTATVTEFVKKRLSPKENKVFIFGSAVRKNQFRDVDIGIMGKVDETALSLLKEDFEKSNFPYVVDIVDFSQVSPGFKQKVFEDKMVWLRF
ncbi:MAG: nucleotidyltransferase domain-containing protein [Patescibacteria group bacterium]